MSRYVPLAASALAFAAYATISIIMWRQYMSPSWDLGIFTQLAKAYAHFEAPIVPIKGEGFNLLGDHFHPILVLLAPVYWIYPSGLSLLLLQCALLGLSAYPVVRYAQARLTRAGVLLLALSYIASWGFIGAVWSQFHEVAFAVPLIAWGLVWWLEGHYLRGSIAISLLVFVKEDLPLTVMAFGLAILLGWRAQWKHAVFHLTWGAAWFIIATQIVLPALNPGGVWDYTDNVSLLGQMIEGLPLKIMTTCLIIVAAGIIGLRSPLIVMVIPTLAWRFTGNVEFYWGWHFHYSAVFIPILALALLHKVEPYSRIIAPAIAAGFAVAMLPFTALNWLWQDGRGSDGSGAVEVASRYNKVASDTTLLAYLVPHTTVYWYGSMGDVEVDAIAVNWWRLGKPAEEWATERYGGQWVTVYSEGRWEVVERRSPGPAILSPP